MGGQKTPGPADISGKFFLKDLQYSPYFITGLRYDHLLGFDSFSLEPVYEKFKKTIFGAQFGVGLEFITLRFCHTQGTFLQLDI